MQKYIWLILFFSASFGALAQNAPGECAEIASKVLKSSKFSGRPSLSLETGSLFDQYPDLHEKMLELTAQDIDLPAFYKQFESTHQRPPTLRDGLNHIYEDKALLIQKYEELVQSMSDHSDPQVQLFIAEVKASKEKLNSFKDLDEINDSLAQSFSDGKSHFSSLDEIIELQDKSTYLFQEDSYRFLKDKVHTNHFHGEHGELMAYASLKGPVLQKGLVFKNTDQQAASPAQQMINQKVEELSRQLDQMSDDELLNFLEPHSDGLFRHAQEYLEENKGQDFRRDELIEKMMNFIKSKEIDLVSQKGNKKTVWSEVKTYSKPIGAEVLKGNGGHQKTILEQLIEHRSLRDVLGLTDEVELQFISPTSIVSPEAKEMIEELGFQVLSAF